MEETLLIPSLEERPHIRVLADIRVERLAECRFEG